MLHYSTSAVQSLKVHVIWFQGLGQCLCTVTLNIYLTRKCWLFCNRCLLFHCCCWDCKTRTENALFKLKRTKYWWLVVIYFWCNLLSLSNWALLTANMLGSPVCREPLQRRHLVQCCAARPPWPLVPDVCRTALSTANTTPSIGPALVMTQKPTMSCAVFLAPSLTFNFKLAPEIVTKSRLPVAPRGCPLEMSPPLGLTTYLPPYVLSPRSINSPALPAIASIMSV